MLVISNDVLAISVSDSLTIVSDLNQNFTALFALDVKKRNDSKSSILRPGT